MCEANAKVRSREALGRTGSVQTHQGTRMGTETGDLSRHLGSQMKNTHLLFEEMKFSYYATFTNASKASSIHTNRLQTHPVTGHYLCYILFTVRALQTAHQAFLLLLFQEPMCAES